MYGIEQGSIIKASVDYPNNTDIKKGELLSVVVDLKHGVLCCKHPIRSTNPTIFYVSYGNLDRVIDTKHTASFVRLFSDSKAPTRAHTGDAGVDLYIHSIARDDKTRATVLGTGIAVEIPSGYVGYLHTRSSLYKRGWYSPVGVGVIDSGYRGELKLIVSSFVAYPDTLLVGDRVCQLVLVKTADFDWHESTSITDTDRGSGGFGHTGSR